MRLSRNFYKNSAFYESQSGDAKSAEYLKANMLKVFANKNIQYTADMPTIKVPTPMGDPEARHKASIREKILHQTHRQNNSALLQRKYAFDGTIFSEAINVLKWDFNKRCVKLERFDPRYCFYQFSNDNERRIIAFWAVYPITRAEAERRYGIKPTHSHFDNAAMQLDQSLSRLDGQDRFMLAVRIDETTRVAWVGDQFVEEPHEHQMGFMPVDICIPFEDGDTTQHGAFYLDDLVPLQAEYNDAIRRRARIVRRLSNPIVWGRGIMNRQFDDIEKKFKGKTGGMVGIGAQGELGLLQVSETNMIDNHKNDILTDMMRVSGFSGASFGELVGANTSGDALGMYFTPTTRHINDQMVSWVAFWESINSKILRLEEKFSYPNEKRQLSTYMPVGTLMPIVDAEGNDGLARYDGASVETYTSDDIGGNYANIVIPPSVTPKDEVVNKRFWMEAASTGFVSRTTAYEEIGILSPQDELQLLTTEQSNPVLNPDGMQKIANAIAVAQGATQQPVTKEAIEV
jgi:hypothetical protein